MVLLKELFAKVPFRLSDEECRMLDREEFLAEDWFVYRCDIDYDWITDTKAACVSVTCPQCENIRYVDKVHRVNCCGKREIGFSDDYGNEYFSKSKYECPFCGATGTVRHCSEVSKYKTCIDAICVGRCYSIEDYAVFATHCVEKEVDKQGLISFRSYGLRAYAVYDGKLYMAVGFQQWFQSVSVFQNWALRKRAAFPDLRLSYMFPIPAGLFDGTETENSHLDRYVADSEDLSRYYPHVYLALWCRYRNIENLVMSGCTAILNSLIDAHSERSYYRNAKFHLTLSEIDFRKKRPHEMLRVDKPMFCRMKSEKWDYKEYQVYSLFYARGIRLEQKQLDQLLKSDCTVNDFRDQFKRGLNPFKIVRYLESEKAKQKRRNGFTVVGYSYLTDYWRLVELCGEELTADRLFPKDLVRAHDRQNKRYQAAKDELLNSRIAERGVTLNQLSFEDAELGYLIRPCMNHGELINEGKLLHHCVAGYAESVASGKTSIFFIRKTAEADQPFYTLELDPEKREVRQNRGLRNCDRTPEVVKFEQEWLEYIRRLKAI